MGLHGKIIDAATTSLSSFASATNEWAGLEVLWVEGELFKLALLTKTSVEPQTNPKGYTYCHCISVKDHMGLPSVYVSVL